MLEINQVTKRYDSVKAVDSLSLLIEPGGIYGLLGPNGAGKTTTIRMVMRIIEPDEGEIKVFGEVFEESMKDRIGYLPEERGLYRKMKVLELVIFLAEIKGVSRDEAEKRGRYWIDRVGLSEWEDKNLESLSKGMQQKIQFISTVIHQPDLIILDEPFAGLDPINTEVLKDIVMDLKSEGRTIVLSTHLMDQVEKLCERICLINRGRKVLEGELAAIKRRFSEDVVMLKYSGDKRDIEGIPGVEGVTDFGKQLSVTLKPEVDGRDFLRAVLGRGGDVEKFEMGEMSLNDIFISKVKEEGGEVEDEAV